MKPNYLISYEKKLLESKIELAARTASSCELCPRKCGVNRLNNEKGFCQTGRHAQVASFNLHFGEEEPLVGNGGSGTVFFAHCNLGCVFCQNFDISSNQQDHQEYDAQQLALIYLRLQESGAENINLVTPSHVILQIVESIALAAEQGLKIPLVYNTSSYDELSSLKILDGIVDIYLADSKFFDPEYAQEYADAPDYPEKARQAILEMQRQTGTLALDNKGIARQGLMIRHLVMPGQTSGSENWLDFFASSLPGNTYINIMNQYRPEGLARNYPELVKPVPGDRVQSLKQKAISLGLTRLDKRTKGFFKLF